MERVTLITVLLVFLAGFAFASWGVPFFDNLLNTIAVWFQKIQGKMAVTITEDSVKATKLKQELEKTEQVSNSHAIGFVISNEEEEEEEEYEDDE